MAITLQTTREPLGLSIGVVPEAAEMESPGPDVGLLVEALRIVANVQAQGTISQLTEKLSTAAMIIQDLERELEEERAAKRAAQPGLASRVATSVRRALMPKLPVRSIKARQVLQYDDPLFLDLETTGRTKRDKIVEVAVTDSQGHVLYSTLVDPGRHIPEEATAVHRIGDRDVVGAPTWEEVAPALRKMLERRTVVAHYAKFDQKYLAGWQINWVCTKELADAVFGQAHWTEAQTDWRRSGKLADRLRQCGLQPGPEHSAAGDCLSTVRLMRYLAGYGEPVELSY